MNISTYADYPARVMVTKIGLDGHDRGARVVAAALRDAGMEVVYTGPWKTIPDVVSMALEEDVDLIGISSLATDHLLVPELVDALRESGLSHVRVVVGGIVPDSDEEELLKAGVSRVFHPGNSLQIMVGEIHELVAESRADPSRELLQ
jgi:methylmalonyl-CoA mutase C-terminal domain/subunit